MAFLTLNHLVSQHVKRLVAETDYKYKQIGEILDFLAFNVNKAAEGQASHESSYADAHGVRELVLDALYENLLENGGFEVEDNSGTFPQGWTSEITTTNTTVAFDPTVKKYGTRSVKVAISATGVSGYASLYQDVFAGLASGLVYTLSFFYRQAGDTGIAVQGIVRQYDSGGSLINEAAADLPAATDWYRGKVTFRVLSETSNIRAVLRVNAPAGATGSIWIDYALLNQGGFALRTPELVAGIIRGEHIHANEITSEHIGTNGLDASIVTIRGGGGSIVLDGNKLLVNNGKVEMNLPDRGIKIDNTDGFLVEKKDASGNLLSQAKFNEAEVSLLNGRVSMRRTFDVAGVPTEVEHLLINEDGVTLKDPTDPVNRQVALDGNGLQVILAGEPRTIINADGVTARVIKNHNIEYRTITHDRLNVTFGGRNYLKNSAFEFVSYDEYDNPVPLNWTASDSYVYVDTVD